MTIQHKSLRDEILFVIGRASEPLDSGQIYERCELADEIKQVSQALWGLKEAKKLTVVEGSGRPRYVLANGVSAPAPAGKAGRSKAAQKNDAATAKPADAAGLLTVGYGMPLTGTRPAPESTPPALDIPTLGDRPADSGKPVPSEAVAADDAAIAKGLDLVEAQLSSERLADAILARLKRQLAPTLCELEAAAGMDRVNVHIHIEQVDFHLGGL